ncbi:DUF305 domain-containing protein [Actinopolymorpha alba]|uniref:DUF305 domain-containing protein n=1 Tax=Actinopolymorpha alba TaxID=533267 RepID=UPI0003704A64|nr:DUF305 domain-containing protein [Actinopolymorpha alba]
MRVRKQSLPLGRIGLLVVPIGLAVVVGLTGCTPDPEGGASPASKPLVVVSPSAMVSVLPGAHNAQDVAFAEAMIAHHQQAIMMSDLADSRAHNASVKTLAKWIEEAQKPEIEQMSAWLRAWGKAVPTPDPDLESHLLRCASPGMSQHMGQPCPSPGMTGQMPGTEHQEHMPGMMSQQELGAMVQASGAAFDRAYLQLMIRHHEGAIEMAKVEQRKGKYLPAKMLAASIATSQSAEITEMRRILRLL